MNSIYFIVAVVLVLVVIGTVVGLVFSNRKRSQNYQNKFGSDYEQTVKTMGNAKLAQTEMDDRVKHVSTLDIRPLTETEHAKYLSEWETIQTKFIDQPAQATVEADHLIMEVMQTRNYPISDFEQRAADISIKYPNLVANYRAARAIAINNKERKATTEELREAFVHYRSLFDELLEPDYSIEKKN